MLSVQIPFQRMLDGRVTKSLQRPEVVAHRRDVAFGGVRDLPERHAILAPLREEFQGGHQETVPRTLTDLPSNRRTATRSHRSIAKRPFPV